VENSNSNTENDKFLTVQGVNSGKHLTISVEVVVSLVNAYMTIIPNEKRDLKTALKVLRFHEGLAELLKAEYQASAEYIEKKAKENAAEELKNNTEEE
jgi:hypothetical protein